MVTLWLRRGNDRRLHPRWPRRNKEAASTEGSSSTGGRGNRYHSRSPTRAMIQLLRGRQQQQQQQQQQTAAPNYSSAAQAYAGERQAESSSESRSDDTRTNPEYGSDDSDMSTFDTTTFNNKSKKIDDTLYPILHPTASGCGLEVNYSTTPPRSNNKISNIQQNQNTVTNNTNAAKPRSANVVLNPLRRQLSPLTLGSTRTANSSLEEERQDTATVPDDSVPILPPNVVVSSDTSQPSQQHPQQVPTLSPPGGGLAGSGTYSDDAPSSSLPPLPSNISKDTTIKMASLSRIGTLSKSTSGNHVKGKFKMTTTKKQHASTKHPAPASSPPWLVSELFQRCADCYCMSNKNNKNRDSSTVLLEDMESEEEQPEYFQFLPFGGCLEEEDLAVVVPKICETIATGPQKAKTKALRQLAQLCDRDHDHNRIPLVCSCEQWNDSGNANTNVVRVLCESVLLEPTTSWKDYRQALLILSNLTLPMENKAVLMLGPMKDTLLPALYQGLRVGHYDNNIGVQGTTTSSSNLCSSNSSSALSVSTPSQQQQQLEVHLVCAILFNLSFLHDGKSSLLNATVGSATDPAVVSSYYTREASPLDVPTSLLRTLERMMQRFVPYVADNNNKRRQQQTNGGDSVERQALRWTLGMMRNLCQDSDVARVIGQTQIPQLALELLQAADAAQCHKWKNQSMEDLALGMLVELALRENEQEAKYIMAGPEDRPYVRPAVLVPSLYALSCRDYLEPLLQDVGGIHGVRAMAIVKRFDTRHHDDEHSRQQKQQDVTMVAASTASF